jgi:Uma2 family endonuclease
MGVKQLLTAEDVWAMPEPLDKRFELVDGELVEVPGVSALHSLIAELVLRLVGAHARARSLGIALGDNTSYILRRDPDLVRVPDASFISWDRVPREVPAEGYWPFAPDLAVEIVSPGNREADVRAKVREYLDTGARLVWVLRPQRRTVAVHTPGTAPRELGPNDELDGGDVLPGFRARVADLFAMPQRPDFGGE